MGDYHQMRSEESEAIDGVRGEFGTCGEDAPADLPARVSMINPAGELFCTRYYSHQGDHVAAHTNGSILARWGSKR